MPAAALQPPLIEAKGLTKSFGAIRALRGVSLSIRRGEVHGLVGANGAGKSTFLNVLGGVVAPDGGSLLVDGEPTTIAGPRRANDLGFSFIYQELALIPQFSAYDNMTMRLRAQTPFGIGDAPRRRRAAQAVAERLHLKIDLDKPVGSLSVAERGLVAIGRALVGEARLISMDEPTAALSDAECDRLFAVVRELTAGGVAVAYVSHRLDEIEALCDTVTVFKDGEVVDRFARGGYARHDLITGITGQAVVAAGPRSTRPAEQQSGEPLLDVRHLARHPRVSDVSFKLYSGEILGLAGLVGAGRTEVVRLIFGADQADAGQMLVNGQAFAPRKPGDAIGKGFALVPEERRSQALVMDETLTFNMNMGNGAASRRKWLPILDDSRSRALASRMVDVLRIKAKSVTAAVRTLSGGNQQKVVFGRWLLRNARVMLLDEPTRGVDVGARQQIWKTVEDFAAEGGGAIVISSELEELAVCHRVVVMVEGKTVGELRGSNVTEERMLEMIYGAEGDHVW